MLSRVNPRPTQFLSSLQLFKLGLAHMFVLSVSFLHKKNYFFELERWNTNRYHHCVVSEKSSH